MSHKDDIKASLVIVFSVVSPLSKFNNERPRYNNGPKKLVTVNQK